MADGNWQEVAISAGLFENLGSDDTDLRQSTAALENAFQNEAGGITRFWGLVPFTDIGAGRVYLSEFAGDLVAVTSAAKVFRIDENGAPTDCTGVVPGGGQR